MKKNDLTNSGTSKNNTERIFTKGREDGMVEYVEQEVDQFTYNGFEVVRREMFSKIHCPAVTFSSGKVYFNMKAIKKLNECSHIQFLINQERKEIIAKPCDEDEKDSQQWSRINKQGKLVHRHISGKIFTGHLFALMNWDLRGTYKCLGTLIRSKRTNETLFVFELSEAESYVRLHAPTEDNPNRHERVPLIPFHWQGRFGKSYEESKKQMITTFEGAPEGFVKIEFPEMPSKKSISDMFEEYSNKNKKGDLKDETTV